MDTDREKLECLRRGDPRVTALLGRQKPPGDGERIRRSCFVYPLYDGGRYLLFHTLTRRLLSLPPRYIDLFADGRLHPASVLAGEVPGRLYAQHFLVPEHTRESRLYLDLKDLLVLKEELPRGITHYVILPTSTCNARCFYCFEQGMQYRKMSPQTVEDTLQFIIRHKPAEAERVHIHWFGGEPMCAPENIDRICQGLTAAGLAFDAEMTSNGSLFTEASIERAARVWRVSRIQITLDGMAEEYARRKRYTAALQDPFGTVIRNVHRLLAAGIAVTLRLNTDRDNLGEIFRLVDFLGEAFSPQEREGLRVYAHALYSHPVNGNSTCPGGAGDDELAARVLEINDYILRRGLDVLDLSNLFTLRAHFCMATAPACNMVIDAAGRLFVCEAMAEGMGCGDVVSGIDPRAWDRIAAPCRVQEACRECVFLPQCTEFHLCPNRTPYDDCVRQEKQRLEHMLRCACQALADTRQPAGARKEDPCVPD